MKADISRQRILERAGWQFWRCLASTFIFDKEKCVKDLIQTLNNHGIEPLGVDNNTNRSIHSEFRRVKVCENPDALLSDSISMW